MFIIHKYNFVLSDSFTLDLPENAIILDCKLLGGAGKNFVLWAIVNDNVKKEKRDFRIFGTGHQLTGDDLIHIKTIPTIEGFVWHVFENRKRIVKPTGKPN